MAQTDGVPLLVEEMLDAHLDAGSLRREGSAVQWSAEARSVVPRPIVELTRERLNRLKREDRRPVVAGGCWAGSIPAGWLRDAVVENATLSERSDLHQRAAEALDALHGEEPEWLEERAHHREAIRPGDQSQLWALAHLLLRGRAGR